jgi:large subunit ribosomal protein L4e
MQMPAKKKPDNYAAQSQARRVNVYDLDGAAKGEVQLPEIFNSEFRPDVIRRAVDSSQSKRRQVYSPSPTAGMRHVVSWPGKGRGMARTPRLQHGSGKGAQVPNTPGGRRAHPPKVEKDYAKQINRKERELAMRSALAACADVESVRARGHLFKEGITLPVVVEDEIEELPKIVEDKYESNPAYVKEASELLRRLGVLEDVERAHDGIHVRAGRGKMRGRRYRTPRSVLVVVSDRKAVERCFRNLAGVEVTVPRELSLERLAPGGDAGRLMLISRKALDQLKGAVA